MTSYQNQFPCQMISHCLLKMTDLHHCHRRRRHPSLTILARPTRGCDTITAKMKKHTSIMTTTTNINVDIGLEMASQQSSNKTRRSKR